MTSDAERIARALEPLLGEVPLCVVLDRVTALVAEIRAEDREACLEVVADMQRRAVDVANRHPSESEFCDHAVYVLQTTARGIRARGAESKTGGR